MIVNPGFVGRTALGMGITVLVLASACQKTPQPRTDLSWRAEAASAVRLQLDASRFTVRDTSMTITDEQVVFEPIEPVVRLPGEGALFRSRVYELPHTLRYLVWTDGTRFWKLGGLLIELARVAGWQATSRDEALRLGDLFAQLLDRQGSQMMIHLRTRTSQELTPEQVEFVIARWAAEGGESFSGSAARQLPDGTWWVRTPVLSGTPGYGIAWHRHSYTFVFARDGTLQAWALRSTESPLIIELE